MDHTRRHATVSRASSVSSRLALAALALSAWLASTPPALAHEDLLARIAALTHRIAQEPANSELYLKRGELFRQHEEWDGALLDFERASKLDPQLTIVDLLRGLTLLEAGNPKPAQLAFDRFLSRHPEHAEALAARGRAWANLGETRAAAADLTRAIAVRPLPEHYLERAQILAAAGRADEALQSLDESTDHLGPLVSLQRYAIELELKLGRHDAALARLDALSSGLSRQEAWLVRRGEILERAGRGMEARAVYTQALAALEALPGHLRATRAMAELETRVRAALERLRAHDQTGS